LVAHTAQVTPTRGHFDQARAPIRGITWCSRPPHTAFNKERAMLLRDGFASLASRAAARRRDETDPIRRAWWTGYARGLRRAHLGESFGDTVEHAVWASLVGSSDPLRDARGRGYNAGLTFEYHEPD
jgi:ribosome modulation factor